VNRLGLVCAAGLLAGGVVVSGQKIAIPEPRRGAGDSVTGAFEGWYYNPDGTRSFLVGYYNRNNRQELDVPIGPENNFDPPTDRGQPTHFYPSRKWWVFKVVVPGDWPKDRRLVWTLTTNGRTSQAKGWLQPEWEVDADLIAKNAARDPSLMTNGTNETDLDHENRHHLSRIRSDFAAAAHFHVDDSLLVLTNHKRGRFLRQGFED